VVKGASHVGDIRLGNERKQAAKEAKCSADFPSIRGFARRDAKETAEEFISAIDQVNFHSCAPIAVKVIYLPVCSYYYISSVPGIPKGGEFLLVMEFLDGNRL
jgi:hypothetical protein